MPVTLATTTVRLDADALDELMLVRDGLLPVTEVELPQLVEGAQFVDLEGVVVATVEAGELRWGTDDSRAFAGLYGSSLVEEGREERATASKPDEPSGFDAGLASSPLAQPPKSSASSPLAQPPRSSASKPGVWVEHAADHLAEHAPRDAVLLVPTSPSHDLSHRAAAALRSALTAAATRPDLTVAAVPVNLETHPQRRRAIEAAYGIGETITLDGKPSSTGTFVLFTGLSGSGKSTLARGVREALTARGETVTLLDGDVVRRELSAGLGFSPQDRDTNVRRIGWVGAQIAAHGGFVLACPIAPYDATRRDVRRTVERAGARLVLVHVATPLTECERRDRKGLYARARRGEIPDFTGISAPYEAPLDADLVIDTTGLADEDAVATVLRALPD
ncbi:adenylyl-sulfate kinase [Calidifontibacter sp. DB0510]|uniref:Adenylyl-sulfate kinase n=1 Tax=Metallococcus carri TaxID=1656884 RepID=A0A967EHM4_9MICO|nr:adenylyl-sulfate kinase [Metallococcus carri]NHN56583.1 adenylyl-sulfate kinase [Metallococcus carri]NOP38882.1 adenylyl-sulfate kinase [Calidifontibacter sp. DB2511S]